MKKVSVATFFEKALTVAYLMLSMGSLSNIEGLDRPIYFSILALSALFGCLLVIRHLTLKLLLKALPYIGICLYFLISLNWNTAPEISLRAYVSLGIATLVGLYIACRWSVEEQVKIYWWCGLLVVLGSYLAILFFPARGITMGDFGQEKSHAGDWRGIFYHKNALGSYTALAVFLFLSISRRNAWTLLMESSLLVLSAVLLYNSHSSTAIITVASLLCLYLVAYPAYRVSRGKIIAVTLLAASGIGLLCVVVENIELFSRLLGKNLTFTGRIYIWSALRTVAMTKPWFGYGYAGFWPSSTQAMSFDAIQWPSYTVWQLDGSSAPHAHNSFFDIYLQGGWIALGYFAILSTRFFWNSFRYLVRAVYLRIPYRAAIFPMGALVYVLVYSCVETVLFRAPHFHLTMFLSLAMGLEFGHRAVKK